ncbi:MAG: GTP cyclohydrolase II [Deltaproteobacteria bacterium]|nr:GTP cyclohydrolase II [Deltaproteobacteria bacterium]
MFTYLNPEIRERLIDQGSLLRIDDRGRQLDPRAQPAADGLTLNLLGPIPLPIVIGSEPRAVDWYASVRSTELGHVEELASTLRESGGQHLFSILASSMAVNSVLVMGSPQERDEPLVRVHSSCLTGDVFGSERCECGPQLATAVDRIAGDPAGGLLIYMAGHEGRGIGLWAKAATYLLQDAGEDTYQANKSLGLPEDSRDFSDAAALLHFFVGNRPMRLLTNNPRKLEDLAAHGLSQITPIKHVTGVSDWNRRYLAAKRDWGHRFAPDDLDEA